MIRPKLEEIFLSLSKIKIWFPIVRDPEQRVWEGKPDKTVNTSFFHFILRQVNNFTHQKD